MIVEHNTNVKQWWRPITDVNDIAARLRASRERANLTQEQLAERAGVSQGTIGNIESGARKAPRGLLSIARALGVDPEWLQTGRARASGRSSEAMAQPVSLWPYDDPPLIGWEELMQIDIPKQFRVRVVDDAMAPLAPAGTICTFAVQAPTVGDGVLVRDASGDLHFRQYRQRVGGGFEARPLNDAYSWLDSAEHDLTVVAVFTGISASLSQLLRAR